jgi:tetratricopeptide (TPR) repeat protein/predicted Ser/Thr protein kinase
MDPKIREIATHASRLEPEDRDTYLNSVCKDDTELRARIERFLARSESVTIDVTDDDETDIEPIDNTHPERVAEYTLIKLLGQGAMGSVHLAQQQRPKRLVALKLIRAESMTESRRRRFELEAESLAKLRHPNIATIYAAGQTDIDGVSHPYFAMELVEGTTLNRACALMNRAERLRILATICDAIEHAHHKGIVHRDLKPANIMLGDDARPKVLDFGVARSMDDESVSELVGTLPYMSPEQLRKDEDVDWRTDIYALGIITHEILTGQRPHDLHDMTIDDALQVVAKPSKSISTTLDPELRAIIRRALEPERDHRYPSAGALANDLRAYLAKRPVSVLADSRAYRARKYIQRNRIPVALATLAVLALITGVIATTYQAKRATEGWATAEQQREQAESERARAIAERERAFASNKFLVDMLITADPESSLGADLTVREVLDTAALTLDQELADYPSVHATVRMALSNTYLSLGELEKARTNAQAMLDVARTELGEDHVTTADARRTLAGVLLNLNEPQRALELLDQARPVIDAYADPVESARLKSERANAMLRLGRQDEALELWSQSEQELTALLGPDHKETLVSMHNRGLALKNLGDLERAEQVMTDVVERRLRTMGPDHPQTLIAQDGLAGIIEKRGRVQEAAEMLDNVATRRERVLGPAHFATLLSKGNLAVALIQLGQIEKAEQLTREALEGHRARFGESHPKTLTLMGNLAYILEDKGNIDEAAALYRQTIDIRKNASSGTIDPETWSPMNNLAMLLMTNGQPDQARPLFEELLAMCDAVLPPGHYYTAIFRDNYAECLIELAEPEAAIAALEQTRPVLEATFGPSHPRVQKSQARLDRARALLD